MNAVIRDTFATKPHTVVIRTQAWGDTAQWCRDRLHEQESGPDGDLCWEVFPIAQMREVVHADWTPDDAHVVFLFSDPNVAFECKMRWGGV